MMASIVRGALALVCIFGFLLVMLSAVSGNALTQAGTGAIVTAAVVCLIGLMMSLDSSAAMARRARIDKQDTKE